MNPLYIFSAFLFLLGDLALLWFLYATHQLTYGFGTALVVVGSFLGYLMYVVNYGVSAPQEDTQKDRLSYDEKCFTIAHPLEEYEEVIPWDSVEAIFLTNRLPQEGEYHNFEYHIFLKTCP